MCYLLSAGHRTTDKESRPKGPGFNSPPEGASMVFPLLRQSAGVLGWWSNGVMKKPAHFEIRAFAFTNTPILQYSSTPKRLAIFTGKAIEL